VGNKPVVDSDTVFDQVSFELRSEEIERIE